MPTDRPRRPCRSLSRCRSSRACGANKYLGRTSDTQKCGQYPVIRRATYLVASLRPRPRPSPPGSSSSSRVSRCRRRTPLPLRASLCHSSQNKVLPLVLTIITLFRCAQKLYGFNGFQERHCGPASIPNFAQLRLLRCLRGHCGLNRGKMVLLRSNLRPQRVSRLSGPSGPRSIGWPLIILQYF